MKTFSSPISALRSGRCYAAGHVRRQAEMTEKVRPGTISSMRNCVAVLLLLSASDALAAAERGPNDAAIALWTGPATRCRNCHGAKGEGAFGPTLAGRKLTVAEFTRAVRYPSGIMPAYITSQITDREIESLAHYFDSMPGNTQRVKWRFEVPPGAPHGQVLALSSGCGQCHRPTLNTMRANLGAIDADFGWFKNIVYNHTTAMPEHYRILKEKSPARLLMGTYSRARMSESQLRDIYDWAREIGFRARVIGRLSTGVVSEKGVTYTLNVKNGGLPGKGPAVEGATIALIVPHGANVVAATGNGYQGTRMDEHTKRTTAVWTVSQMAPKDHQSFTITLSRAATAKDKLRGSIRWTKPMVKTGPLDEQNINPAPL
jgi:mono/diheme cytochrome c family protein